MVHGWARRPRATRIGSIVVIREKSPFHAEHLTKLTRCATYCFKTTGSGTAAKTLGKAMAVAIGFIYVAVQSAAYSGYIDVNWDKVQREAISKIDTDGDGKITEKDAQAYWAKLKKMLTYNLPSASGFSVGFLYGLRA